MATIRMGEPFRPSQIRVGTVIERRLLPSVSGATVQVASPCCQTWWRVKVPEFEYVQDRGWSLDRKCGGCDYRYSLTFPQGAQHADVTAKGDGPGKGWRKGPIL